MGGVTLAVFSARLHCSRIAAVRSVGAAGEKQGVVMIKRWVLMVLMVAGSWTAFAELTEDERDRLEDLEIAGVGNDTEKDDDRNKIEVLEINTFQSEDDDGEGFRIRIVAELVDKQKKLYRVDFKGNRPGGINSEYTGEDYWLLYMPHGELERVKLTAYAVQYGFMDGDDFIVFAEDLDGVETVDELLERAAEPFPEKVRLKHYYIYEDSSEGERDSIAQSVREIK